MIYQSAGRVIENRQVIPGYYRLILWAPQISASAQSGQFVVIQCAIDNKLLLKRPLGIYQSDSVKGTITLIYKVVGSGTEKLAICPKGTELSVIGPLGRGFDISEVPKSVLLVAGGLGIIPLFSLAAKIKKNHPAVKIKILWGAATASHFFLEKDFAGIKVADISWATDDGTRGFRGNIGQLLDQKNQRIPPDIIFACGPAALLKKVSEIARSRGVPAQVSVESRMACGFGVCLGCAVKTVFGYKKACTDGPVFNAGDIIWE